MNFLQTLEDDLQFIKTNDPAARTKWEILLCYFGLHAVYIHKLAHWLYKNDLFLLARLVSNFSRFVTGIEIHPGAKISRKVFIDHGVGVVIGETAEVEEEVIIYQGVTLGGTSTKAEKRHPTIKKGSVIGSHAQVLGNITVGENSRIGAGSVVVKDVPPETTMVGIPAREASKASGEKLDHNQIPDMLCDRIKVLEEEVERLKKH
ncbi:MAG: serine O-acetyltransferase [Candidatus Caenarcaniphilales bacterium]|nr:serine O-acetyltransferase [Candidatus Caenarcaniphilales bacterium]